MISTATRGNIHCPVGLFRRHEGRVALFTHQIYRARTIREKARAATALLAEVNVLLRCEEHDEASVDCRMCQGYAELRQCTATAVVQAATRPDRRPDREQAWAA